MDRMQRVLAAAKRAELAQLGLAKTQLTAARARAHSLRTQARTINGTGAAGEMALIGAWQSHAERAARDADAEAEALARHVQELEAVFARTLGRETVVDGMVARLAATDQQIAARRAETVPARRAGPAAGA